MKHRPLIRVKDWETQSRSLEKLTFLSKVIISVIILFTFSNVKAGNSTYIKIDVGKFNEELNSENRCADQSSFSETLKNSETEFASPKTSGRKVKGKIIDAVTKEPLIGASIWIKETSRGATTDVNGKFSIAIEGKSSVLVVSYIGYDNLNIEVEGRSDLGSIKLSPTTKKLDDVVIVGYGSQKKASVIGSISSINAKELKVPSSKISNVLAGRLGGIVSVSRTGEPGEGSEFYIRGISTFGTNRSPLVLVDGIERKLDLVDPEDIQSFSILKDATATAVYGVRGANGVILITTRSGKEGKPKVNIRFEQGVNGTTMMPKMVDAVEFAEMYNEVTNSSYYTPEMIEKYKNHSDPDLYPNVDWIGELYKNFAQVSKLNANIFGGGRLVRYYIASSFYDEGSIFREEKQTPYNSSMHYSKVNFRANVDVSITPTTSFKVNFANIYEKKRSPGVDMYDIWEYTFATSANAFPMRYSDGRFSGPNSGIGFNPYNLLMRSGYANDFWNSAQSLVTLSQDLRNLITPGLKADIKFSWDASNAGRVTRPETVRQWLATGRDENGNLQYNVTNEGDESLGFSNFVGGSRSIYFEGSLSYDQTFKKKHKLGALLLYNQKQRNNLSATTATGSLPYRNQGIAGRLTYSFDDRYFAEANMGYNGSENFAPGHRFGFFPAGAIGYLVSNEKFWDPLKNVIDMCKLKASYGIVGNDEIGGGRRFIYEETIISINNNYQFGRSGETAPSRIRMGDPSNLNVSWETSKKFNIGTEISLFNSLKLTGDFFSEKREGIFLNRRGLPTIVGLSSIPYVNIGKMQNKGFEGTFNLKQRFGDLFVTAMGNFVYAKNTIIENDEPDWNYPYRNRKGKSYGQPFGLVALGLFKDEAEIKNSPRQTFGPVRPGDIKYSDVNKDGIIDDSDEMAIGYPSLPQINYGFGITAQWRGFDCSAFFQGIAQTSLYTFGESIYGFTSEDATKSAINKDVYLHRWTEKNPDPNAIYPRLGQNNENNNKASTYRLFNAGFLRMKNFELGYTLPKLFTKKFFINSLRVYLAGVNTCTFSSFKLWDPEIGSGEGGSYPPNKSFMVGVNIHF